MNRKIALKEIKRIAKREGKKESEIRDEMRKAIIIGFMNPSTKFNWSNIFGEGHLPSPEEFISVIVEKVK